jgi:hypothetical protein
VATGDPETPASEPDASAAAEKSDDVVLVHGVTEDRAGYRVLRKRADKLEAGVVRTMEEGKPIHGEVVRLHARPEQPLVYDVEVQLDARAQKPAGDAAPTDDVAASAGDRTGPAQVASEPYREGWDAIWGAATARRRSRPS